MLFILSLISNENLNKINFMRIADVLRLSASYHSLFLIMIVCKAGIYQYPLYWSIEKLVGRIKIFDQNIKIILGAFERNGKWKIKKCLVASLALVVKNMDLILPNGPCWCEIHPSTFRRTENDRIVARDSIQKVIYFDDKRDWWKPCVWKFRVDGRKK